MRTLALIVGVGGYADNAFAALPGPVGGAIAIAHWLLARPAAPPLPADVKVFLSLPPNFDQKAVDGLAQKGVDLHRNALRHEIESAVDQLIDRAKAAGEACRFLLYWSGHGYASLSGDRFWVCSDTTSANKRMLNGTALHRRLGSIPAFREQLMLVDTCAVHWDKLIDPNYVNWPQSPEVLQNGLFAAPEGDPTLDAESTGLFTRIVLQQIADSAWPDGQLITDKIIPALNQQNVKPLDLRVLGRNTDYQLVVGPKPAGSPAWMVEHCLELTEELELDAQGWGPPLRAVLFDYGKSAAIAADPAETLRRLSYLDGTPKRLSRALLQFVLRLASGSNQKAVEHWLKAGVAAKWISKRDIRETQAKLKDEEPNRIMVVELNSIRDQVTSFTCRVQLRSGATCSPAVKHDFTGWDAFDATVMDTRDAWLADGILQSNRFDCHFVVDLLPQVFRPFHRIGGNAAMLGQESVVVLRYQHRLPYSTERRQEIEKFLGRHRRTKLQAIPPGAPETDPMGFYYAAFVLTHPVDRDLFRRLLLHAKNYNLPFVCWLHEAAQDHSWDEFKTTLQDWLDKSRSLDRFPEELLAIRTDPEQPHAEYLSLLWDDPSFSTRSALTSRL